MDRRGLRLAVILAPLLLPFAACGGDDEGAPVVTYYVPPDNSGLYQKTVDRCNEEAGGDYQIELAILPSSADGQREQLVRRLAAEDADIDVMSMDVIWTAEFAEAGWAVPWPDDMRSGIEAETIPSVLTTGEYEDELYAAPLNTNTQLLWYRKDLVPGGKPPATWDEMLEIAESLPEGENYIEVQASRYEGLTVWFNTLLESAGGSILSGEGEDAEVSLENEPTRAALQVMQDLARSSAVDPNLPNSLEDEGRLAFQDGNAAFMVNYPFVYDAIEESRPEIFEQLGVAPYPSVVEGQPAKVTLGGYNLGVSWYSDHRDLSFDAAACLRDQDSQEIAATEGGLAPSADAVYERPAVKEAMPFAPELRAGLRGGAVRPVSPAYNDISLAVQRTIHPPASINVRSDPRELRVLVQQAIDSRGLL